MASRKPAPRLARPQQRYFKGKAPKGAELVNSDSEEEETPIQVDDDQQEQGISSFGAEDDEDHELIAKTQIVKKNKAVKVTLNDVKVSAEGKVIVGGQAESGKTLVEQAKKDDSSSEEESEEDDAEDESGEEESESEEEQPPVVAFRPMFVPKRARETLKDRDANAPDSEEGVQKQREALERRKAESHRLAGETVKKSLEEKEAVEHGKEIDDTDGLDPEGEFEAWRLRELGRIKRDKEIEIKREEERLELERRRAMPAEQRDREDMERAQKSRDEKSQGQGAFMQKYWHKGAFYQDSDIMKKHDYSQATESQVDVSLLPKIMQVKDFGKRSRTKHTTLRAADTTAQNSQLGLRPDGTAITCFGCGGPHLKKDCPLNTGALTDRPAPEAENATRANRIEPNAGPKKWGIGAGPGRDDSGAVRNIRRSRSRSRERERDYNRRHHSDRRSPRRGQRADSRDRYGEKRRRYRSRTRSRSPARRSPSPGQAHNRDEHLSKKRRLES